jgi:hypothetical protein
MDTTIPPLASIGIDIGNEVFHIVGFSTDGGGGRGRDGDYSPPPAQNPAGAANAPGSHLGW